MNSLVLDSKNQTPIEILLQIDSEGRTTARKLYQFLELDKSNYSRWVKVNILNNSFAEEGVDFYSSSKTNEGRGNFAEDYKLTASFAKKLTMECHNERGEQARQYFIKVEDKLKEAVKLQKLEYEKIQAQKARAEAMLLNAKNRTYKTIMQSVQDKHLSPIAIEVFGLKGLEGVFGIDVGNYLPKTEKTYSATEVGQILGGISANKVGTLANRNGLKTEEYGITVMDKSRYSNKEVPSFRYNKKAIEKLKELITA